MFFCFCNFFVFAILQIVCQLFAIWTSLSKQMLTWYVYCDDVVPLVCKVNVYFNKKLQGQRLFQQKMTRYQCGFIICLSCLAVRQWNLLADMNLARYWPRCAGFFSSIDFSRTFWSLTGVYIIPKKWVFYKSLFGGLSFL